MKLNRKEISDALDLVYNENSKIVIKHMKGKYDEPRNKKDNSDTSRNSDSNHGGVVLHKRNKAFT